MILIAFDGSDDGKAAIEQSGKLFAGETVTVLTVWEHFIDTMARIGGGYSIAFDYVEIDAEAEKDARKKAEEGAALAREAGLDASARTAVVDSTVADAILADAAAIEAGAVVFGSRGRGGVRSLMLGSTSHHVLQHADRPVVVVPSPLVAAARAEHRKGLK